MSGISTHVLDVSRGVAAEGVGVSLEFAGEGGRSGWKQVFTGATDADGRVKAMVSGGAKVEAGDYRVRFATGVYWQRLGVECFHPVVEVTFSVTDAARHHHVPLLLSPFGYTTYRGT